MHVKAMRDLRLPPEQGVFDSWDIPVSHAAAHSFLTWHRLSRTDYPQEFFASKGSRLTPISGAFPCLYIAAERETTVAEVWGDRFAAHRLAGGEVYVISASQAANWAFFEVDSLPNDLRVCDLGDPKTRLALGLDSGSLYAADFTIPQTWAERIARHPAGFDGIFYRSRLTDLLCAVFWDKPPPAPKLSDRIKFTRAAAFCGADAAYILAAQAGIRLSFGR